MKTKQISKDIVDIICPNHQVHMEDLKIKNFLEDLSEERDINSLRLLICIGIDIKNSFKVYKTYDINNNNYVSKLKNCLLLACTSNFTPSSFPFPLNNRQKFACALNQIPLAEKLPCIESKSKNNYSKVSSFSDYLKYMVNKNKPFNLGVDKMALDAHEIERLYREFQHPKKRKFRNIKIGIMQHFRYFFVADREELRNTGYHKLLEILDGLGYYMENVTKGDYYISMEYDPDFSEKTWQPDSLSGDWGGINDISFRNGNEFFLSYMKKNGWGKTYSISGKGNCYKEKIHLPFDNTGGQVYEMNVEDLGNVKSVVHRGHNISILKEALLRHKKILI